MPYAVLWRIRRASRDVGAAPAARCASGPNLTVVGGRHSKFLSSGTPHTIENTGFETLKLLSVFIPLGSSVDANSA
jgi:hypothetical protein